MIRYYTEEQIVTAVSRLTRTRLVTYVEHAFLCPSQTEKGAVFSAADLARAELICDLVEQFDLQDEALGVVLSLIDQLHGVRAELRCVMAAIEELSPAEQQKVLTSLRQD